MSDNFSKLSWETIEKDNSWSNYEPFDGSYLTIRRAKVIGGWLIDKNIVIKRTFRTKDTDVEFNSTTSITFVPDPNYNWKL
jgi:hypothetical protein